MVEVVVMVMMMMIVKNIMVVRVSASVIETENGECEREERSNQKPAVGYTRERECVCV